MRIVPGAELSAHDGEEEIHILALHVHDVQLLEARLEPFRDSRRARAELIVDRLSELGMEVTMPEVMTEAGNGAVGRPHIARAMLKRGHVNDFRAAFDLYLGTGRPAFVPKQRLLVSDAIRLAHSAGALAVWAHPGGQCRRERLEPLVAMGLDGVESLHPSHARDDVERISALAAFFGIVVSGGSDWHGTGQGSRALGCMQVRMEILQRQEAALTSRAVRSPL